MPERCKKCAHYDGTYCYIGNEIFLAYSRDVEHCDDFEEQVNHSYKTSDIDKEVDKLNRLLIIENKALKEETKHLKESIDRLTNTVSELIFENRVNKKTIVQLKELLEKTEV